MGVEDSIVCRIIKKDMGIDNGEKNVTPITTWNTYVPSTIEELSKFILVGREKLVSVRAEIRAIEKVGLAQEVRNQKLAEAQSIAEAVLDAEIRMGELFAELPKNKVARYVHLDVSASARSRKHIRIVP